jgi:hypothetical protein
MMDRKLLLHGLYVLCVLAVAILGLMAWTLYLIGNSASISEGKVNITDAGQFTALSLMFREVLGRIQSLWENADRTQLTNKLAESQPLNNGGGNGNGGGKNVGTMDVDADRVDVHQNEGAP